MSSDGVMPCYLEHPLEFVKYANFLQWPEKDFHLVKKIAGAIHGEVLLMIHIPTNSSVVVKKMHNDRVKAAMQQMESPMNEIGALWYFSYINQAPFTLQLLDVFRDAEYTYLVTESCTRGELFEIAATEGALGNHRVQQYMVQLLLSLKTLHESNTSHRDVSLENILVHEDGTLRLMDFGQAFLHKTKNGQFRNAYGRTGKTQYRAPEGQDLNCVVDGPALDMFAVGVITFILLVGAPPWETASPQDPRYTYIKQAGIATMLQHWGKLDSFPPLALDFVEKLLHENPASRLTVHQALRHPWLRGVKLDILMRKVNPADGSVEDSQTWSRRVREYLAGRCDPDTLRFVPQGHCIPATPGPAAGRKVQNEGSDKNLMQVQLPEGGWVPLVVPETVLTPPSANGGLCFVQGRYSGAAAKASSMFGYRRNAEQLLFKDLPHKSEQRAADTLGRRTAGLSELMTYVETVKKAHAASAAAAEGGADVNGGAAPS